MTRSRSGTGETFVGIATSRDTCQPGLSGCECEYSVTNSSLMSGSQVPVNPIVKSGVRDCCWASTRYKS